MEGGAQVTARILDASIEAYHKLPGLSASRAIALNQSSPLHVKYMIDHGDVKPTKEMDNGSVVHRMVLGKGRDFVCLPFDDWRTKAAQDSRAKTRAAGLIPLTHVQYGKCEDAAAAILAEMPKLGIEMTGQSELPVEWHEDDVRCRCMFDHVNLTTGEILELKTTGDASPARIERHVEDMGYRISAAAYIRALLALRPELRGRISYTFMFVEMEPPYAVYSPEPDQLFLETGERDWLRAVETWRECTTSGRWPGYQDYKSIGRPQWKLRREGYSSVE
jgi:hypothetical protein